MVGQRFLPGLAARAAALAEAKRGRVADRLAEALGRAGIRARRIPSGIIVSGHGLRRRFIVEPALRALKGLIR
ncbi:hypothetical protein GVO57_07230 [Sphingomonas changnyeongensis]|uniref:Uncharacterized protein n=1 Tax=Sphingomonas changnyeongensis TaxID=2698679 RepID=A0A7Z2S9E4_9SPHN|nr:hypothetical protein [Sphingomonas changnyeongensis]QHL90659.1 hypothetical protein GVO57_07230 [Sphingomonas changnyeongensis]